MMLTSLVLVVVATLWFLYGRMFVWGSSFTDKSGYVWKVKYHWCFGRGGVYGIRRAYYRQKS